MKRLLYILFMMIGFYSVSIGQITVNTNFTPNIAGHIDSRCVLTNLADTSTISFKYEGMLIYVAVPNKFYYYETYWKELASETLIDSYVSNNGYLTGVGTSNYLPVWGGASYLTYSPGTGFVKVTNGNISYDNSTYLTTEVDGSTSNEIQRIDTFEIYDTDKLRISLQNDGQPYKTITLPAGSDTQDLSLDSLSRVFTLTLTNGGTVKWKDTDTNSGGTVTAVTGTSPINSSGGNTPAISIDLLKDLVIQAPLTGGAYNNILPGSDSDVLIGADTTSAITGLVTKWQLSQLSFSDTQDLSLDSLNRVFTLNLTNGGSVKFKDTDTQLSESQVDSYVSNNGYLTGNQSITLTGDATGTGTTSITVGVVDNSHEHNTGTITDNIVSSVENVSNDGGNIDLVGSGIITITGNDGANTITIGATETDGSTSNEVQTLSADSTSTTIGITSSINNSRVHFNVLKSEVDGSITNELVDSFYLKQPNGQLRLKEGSNLYTINSIVYGGSALGANYLPIWAGGQYITSYSGDGLINVSGGIVSTVTNNSSNWNTAYGWGNHANAGYITSETGDISSVTVSSPLTGGGTSGAVSIGIQSDTLTSWRTKQNQGVIGYNDKINSAGFSGTTTKTLTLTQQDGGTVTAQFTDIDTDTQLSAEQVQDYIGAMVTGNTENNMNVDYQDSDGTLDFNITMEKDIVANAPLSGGANNVLIGNDSDVTISVDTTSNAGLATQFDIKKMVSDSSYWNSSGNNIYNANSGYVGIGTTNPTAKLHIAGDLKINTTTVGTSDTLLIKEGNTVKYRLRSSLTTTADSTTVVNSYGTTITENPANQFNIKVDSSKFATPYDLTQLDNKTITLSGDATGTGTTSITVGVVDNSHEHNTGTITDNIVSSVENISNDGGNIDLVPSGIITISGNDGANTITIGATEIDGSTTNELVDSFYLKQPAGQLRLKEGSSLYTINSMVYGGSALGANYLPIWAGGQYITSYSGDGLINVSGGIVSTVTNNSSNWNTAYTHSTNDADISINNEIEVVDEVYNSGNFNGGTTSAVSQDDFYDYQHIADTDDDGKIQVVDLATAGFVKTDVNGNLSVDANTYQTALVNPVTGTGTSNYISKFTGTSAIGNSRIYDNGAEIGIGTTSPTHSFDIRTGSGFRLGNGFKFTVDGGNNSEFSSPSNMYFYGGVPIGSAPSGIGELTVTDGMIGINDITPEYALDVYGSIRTALRTGTPNKTAYFDSAGKLCESTLLTTSANQDYIPYFSTVNNLASSELYRRGDATAFTFANKSTAGYEFNSDNGNSYLFKTPSLSTSYNSGFAIYGSYSNPLSTINLTAYGVRSGGGYGAELAFSTTYQTALTEQMRIKTSGVINVRTLDTDLTAPTTSGKKNVMVADANGDVSFRTSAPITRATNLTETTTTAATWTKINFTSITFETDTNELKLSLTGDTINIKQPGIYEIAFNAFAYMSTDVTEQTLKFRIVKGFPDADAGAFQWQKKIYYNKRENINFVDALNLTATEDLEFQYYWDSGATNCKIDDIVMTIKRL